MSNVVNINPRANGYNYGIGWGSSPKPLIYEQGFALARRLGDQAIKASRAAWQVESACRAVRLAETETEKLAAVRALTIVVQFYDLSAASQG
jgi:hypothetical protein